MALSRPVLIGLVAAGVVVALLFLPLPTIGVHDYNVVVAATAGETCVLGVCSYSMSNVVGQTSGAATVIDVWGWFGVSNPLSLGACLLNCQIKVVATLATGQSSTASESKIVGNVWSIAVTDTLAFSFAYVPAGPNSVNVALYLNGVNEAYASSSFTVGG